MASKPASPAPATPAAPATPKVTKPRAPKPSGFIGKITNKIFAGLPLGSSAKFGGVLKSIVESEGTYGTVTKLKGDFAIEHGSPLVIETANSAYIPAAAVAILKPALQTLGEWQRAEFVLTVTRGASGFTASFVISPRFELPRSVALVATA